jgi:hypothetical protein
MRAQSFLISFTSIEIISLDIMKAFDKVDRKILLHKLAWYGVDAHLHNSFVTDRVQFVKIINNDHSISSELKKTLLGVPQGSSLNNLLFAIMINDLPEHIKKLFTILFVDDSNLVINGPFDQISLILEKLESDLNSVNEWMKEIWLKLNLSKTVFMILDSPHQFSQLHHIKLRINTVEINPCSLIEIPRSDI